MQLEKSVLNERLVAAARDNDLEKALLYLKEGADVSTRDSSGKTAMDYAIALGEKGEALRSAISAQVGSVPSAEQPQPSPAASIPQTGGPMVPVPSGYWSYVSGAYEYVPSFGSVLQLPGAGLSKAAEYGSAAYQWGSYYTSVGGEKAVNMGMCAAQFGIDAQALRSKIQQDDAHSRVTTKVTSNITQKEKDLVNKRQTHSTAMQRSGNDYLLELAGQDIAPEHMPTIGLCFSGGGLRAAYQTFGFLRAAKRLGLYYAASHMSSLSGSTWALNGYIASGLSLDDYIARFVPRMTRTLTEQVQSMTSGDIQEILLALGKKFYDGKQIGIVDIYGALLAHMFLKEFVQSPQQYPLSSLEERMESGNYPFVLSTAVLGGPLMRGWAGFPHRITVEFSPLQIGSREASSFVPSWAFGRSFDRGLSQIVTPVDLYIGERKISTAALGYARAAFETAVPASRPYILGAVTVAQVATELSQLLTAPYYGHELSLGYLMGIWGSAFSVDMYRALIELYHRLAPVNICPRDNQSIESIVLITKNMLSVFLTAMGKKISIISPTASDHEIAQALKDSHLAAARVPNFARGMGGILHNLEELTLVDGGFEMINHNALNIGILPLLYRNLDVITVLDSSYGRGLTGAASLRATSALAEALNLKFPKIKSYEGLDTKHASLIVDPDDLTAPVIIYMPGIANPAYGPIDPQSAAFSSENFTYTAQQAHDLMGLTEYNVMQHSDIFQRAIRLAAERKKMLAAMPWWKRILQ